MGIGDPGQGPFRDAIVTIRNHDIATGLQPLMELRYEVVHAEDLQSRGGLDTPSRDHFVALLKRCDMIRRRVTHNPEDKDLKTLLAESADAKQELTDAENPFGGDNIQMGAPHLYQLPWDLSGQDPNIPLNSALGFGGYGQLLLLAIDSTIVAWTRLESRNRSRSITVHDSLRIHELYQRLYAGLMTFAGDENQVDIAQVLATDEPRGPENAPNRKTETPTGGST